MEENTILSYYDYNIAIRVFYFLFFVIFALMFYFDYIFLVSIDNISYFWLVPIVWSFCLIPPIVCLVFLNSLYYERNKFYSTEFIITRIK